MWDRPCPALSRLPAILAVLAPFHRVLAHIRYVGCTMSTLAQKVLQPPMHLAALVTNSQSLVAAPTSLMKPGEMAGIH